MSFELDKQTIGDLEIFGDERSSHSIFSLYNGTKTSGGKDRLYTLMRNPLDDPEQLQSRQDSIIYCLSLRIRRRLAGGAPPPAIRSPPAVATAGYHPVPSSILTSMN